MASPKIIMAVALLASTLSSVHAADCTTLATALASACSGFASQAKSYGPQLERASYSQIQSLAASQNPTSQCCDANKAFYQPGCSCNPSTLATIKGLGYDISAQGFATLYEASKIGCKWTENYYSDSCPKADFGPGPGPAPAPSPYAHGTTG